MVTEAFYPPHTLPAPMDVVWCRFPIDEKPGRPGVKPRPGLVFETVELRPGELFVKVVYGTSHLKRPINGPGFKLSNVTEMNFAGLFYPTLFDLGRFKTLPWGPAWFESPDLQKYSTPKIGCIQPHLQARLRDILEKRASLGLPNPVPKTAKAQAS